MRSFLIAVAGVAVLAPAADAAILWPTARANGTQGNGDVQAITISPNGRLVAFSSAAENLVPDGNNHRDVFVRNLGIGGSAGLKLVSHRSAAVPGNADADESAEANGMGMDFSADNRYVVFDSQASNLVPGISDTNNLSDVFRLDRTTGKLQLISIARTGGKASDGASRQARISGDGRFVVFQSTSKDLVASPAVNAHVPQVYVRDMQTGTTRMVSVNRAGKSADPFAEHGDISADGRYVIFASDDPNFTTGDANAHRDVFRRTLATGATVRVSRKVAGGTENGNNDFPAISGNGRFVVFETDGTLIPGDANNAKDIYRRDLVSGKLEIVSLKANDAQINGDSIRGTLSADGSRIVFANATNGIAGNDDNNDNDVFVRNTISGHTLRVSVKANGDDAGASAHFPFISGNGAAVAFLVDGSGALVGGDANAKIDGYVVTFGGPSEKAAPTITFSGRYAVLSNDPSGIALVRVGTKLVRPDASRRVVVKHGQKVTVLDGAANGRIVVRP